VLSIEEIREEVLVWFMQKIFFGIDDDESLERFLKSET